MIPLARKRVVSAGREAKGGGERKRRREKGEERGGMWTGRREGEGREKVRSGQSSKEFSRKVLFCWVGSTRPTIIFEGCRYQEVVQRDDGLCIGFFFGSENVMLELEWHARSRRLLSPLLSLLRSSAPYPSQEGLPGEMEELSYALCIGLSRLQRSNDGCLKGGKVL